MQLTLRDFFWLTVVIGLATGIVIEHWDVRALRPYQGKAAWWEQAARNLGQAYEERTGLKPEFHEMGEIDLRMKDGSLNFRRLNFHVKPTDEKPGPWPTGHWDLNQGLIILIGSVCLMTLLLSLQWKFPHWFPKGKVKAQPMSPTFRRICSWLAIAFSVISVGAFALRYPFAGTAYFVLASWLIVSLCPREFVIRFIKLPPLPAEPPVPSGVACE